MSKNIEDSPCPICTKKVWIKNSTLSALPAIEKKALNMLKMQLNSFIPVRAYVCKECGYVRLVKE